MSAFHPFPSFSATSAFDPLRTFMAVLEGAVLDALRIAIDSIPVAIVAFLVPPALWAKVAWASPYLRTYRHGISALLSCLSGILMAASMLGDDPAFPILLTGAAIAMAAMFASLLWPPRRNVR